MIEVSEDITGQIDGALAGLGEGPFVSQASCVDVLLDLYAATGGTALQDLVAAALAHISRVNLVEAAYFRAVLLEIAALGAVAELADRVAVEEDGDDGDIEEVGEGQPIVVTWFGSTTKVTREAASGGGCPPRP